MWRGSAGSFVSSLPLTAPTGWWRRRSARWAHDGPQVMGMVSMANCNLSASLCQGSSIFPLSLPALVLISVEATKTKWPLQRRHFFRMLLFHLVCSKGCCRACSRKHPPRSLGELSYFSLFRLLVLMHTGLWGLLFCMCMQEARHASELPTPRLHKSDPLQASLSACANECTLFAASITVLGCVCTFLPPLSFTLAAIMEILVVVEDLEHIHKTSGGSTFLRGNEKLFFSCILTSVKSQKVHFRGFQGARNTLLRCILPQMKNDRAVLRRWTVSPSPLEDGVLVFHLCSSKQCFLMAPLPVACHRSPRFLLVIDLSSPSWTVATAGSTLGDQERILPESQTPTSLFLFPLLFSPPGLD